VIPRRSSPAAWPRVLGRRFGRPDTPSIFRQGGSDGPITRRWGISGFPSIFVLDMSGVIRFKDVQGEDLDNAGASLLDDATAEASPKR
jgi:hypothetical protein